MKVLFFFRTTRTRTNLNVMSKTYRSEARGAIHETASDLHDAGLMDKRTLRKFDELCLTPVRPMHEDDIRALRERERVSLTFPQSRPTLRVRR